MSIKNEEQEDNFQEENKDLIGDQSMRRSRRKDYDESVELLSAEGDSRDVSKQIQKKVQEKPKARKRSGWPKGKPRNPQKVKEYERKQLELSMRAEQNQGKNDQPKEDQSKKSSSSCVKPQHKGWPKGKPRGRPPKVKLMELDQKKKQEILEAYARTRKDTTVVVNKADI